MARKSKPRYAPIKRRGVSANVVTTIALVVTAVLVIGGVLLFNRSSDGDNATGPSGGIPAELRVTANSNTISKAPDDKVTVVEFLDFQCSACAAYYQNVTRDLETDYQGKVTFVTRNFPLSSHPLAQPAARAAEAAAAQDKYTEMYHALFDNYQQWALGPDGQNVSDDANRAATLFDAYATQVGLDIGTFHTDMTAPAIQQRIDTDRAAGEKVGVRSTPTIFVNGKKFEPSGNQFTDVDRQLRDMIDERLG